MGFDFSNKVNLSPKIDTIGIYRSHKAIEKNMDRVEKV